MTTEAPKTTPDTDAPILLTEVKDGIATLTLNRPRQRNSLSTGLMSALLMNRHQFWVIQRFSFFKSIKFLYFLFVIFHQSQCLKLINSGLFTC